MQVAWRHDTRGLAALMAVVWDGLLSPVDGRSLTLSQVRGDNAGSLLSLDRAKPAALPQRRVWRNPGNWAWPPPKSANQYANDDNYIVETRYCEANATLDGGGSDTVYWTIHHFKESGVDSFRPSACSAKHDSWADGCAQWRPAK